MRGGSKHKVHSSKLTFSAFYYFLPTIYIYRHAPVAQLDRVPDYESGGRMFESCRVHHRINDLRRGLDSAAFLLRQTCDHLCIDAAVDTLTAPQSLHAFPGSVA